MSLFSSRKESRQSKPTSPGVKTVRKVRVGCPAHNCGGRCLLIAHIEDGRITHLETDDRPDTLAAPQLRACVRGRAYLRRQYHPDRLLHPIKRTGKRGEGQFTQVSWDEALDTVASHFEDIKSRFGNSALFVPYGTGSYNQMNGSRTARRLMNLYGGCLGIYSSYSWACIQAATPTVYGTLVTGNQRQDWLNSRYILMWGWNPAEMRDGTNSDYFIKLARQNGARVVCIDPRFTPSAAALADEWIPIRPGTDAAMMSAMAYVMLTEELYDAEFVRTHCLGWDATQMPPGLEDAENYTDYLLGTRDGIPKTPAWAEPITRYLPTPLPTSPASMPQLNQGCSTRVTACNAALMGNRWCALVAYWLPSPATWAFQAAGRADWHCRHRKAG
jgi:anaerobic dimethyl sulfoxide reductase subunit A